MRLKPLFLNLLFIISLTFNLVAQKESTDFNVFWSATAKKDLVSEVLGTTKTGDGYIAIKKETIRGPGGFSYKVQVMNQEMDLLKTIELADLLDEKVYQIVKVFTFGERFILATSRDFNKENR